MMNLANFTGRFLWGRTPQRNLLIFAMVLALTWSVYKWSHEAAWAQQIGLASFFSLLIWMKDESQWGRLLLISIIVGGTILAIFFSL